MRSDRSNFKATSVHQSAVVEIPHLCRLVPGRTHDHWLRLIVFSEMGKANRSDPIGVTVLALKIKILIIKKTNKNSTYRKSCFALAQNVPDFDCLVHGARNDQSIVVREANRSDIVRVRDELANALATKK